MKLMKKFYPYILLLGLMLPASGCDSWVKNVEQPIDAINDEVLNDESQIPFLITGVETRFATVHDQLTLLNDLLSDAFFYDQNVPNATFPQYAEVDSRNILLNNTSNAAAYATLGQLPKYADLLVERVGKIGAFKDAALKSQALYKGNLYSGIGMYFYGVYYGWTEKQGGSPIFGGELLTSTQLLDRALSKLDAALQNAIFDYDKRVVNTFKARIYLLKGDNAKAYEAAKLGLLKGDPDVVSKHSAESENDWYAAAGRGRTQFVANARFAAYIAADAKEANRVLLENIVGLDGRTIYKRQAEYPDRSSSIPFLTWQENELMLAELEMTSNPVSAIAHVNTVRNAYTLAPLNTVDLATILTERDKTFFAQGMRMIDQRRFGQVHTSAGTWEYLPVPQTERDANPNLKAK